MCQNDLCSGAQNLLALEARSRLGLEKEWNDQGPVWKICLWGIKAVRITVTLSLQVAILCQFLREVDYKTAFKALQEQNR